MSSVNVRVRMEEAVKVRAERLFSELGMSLETAVNIFVREALREGGFPFVASPNKGTLAALEEARQLVLDKNLKTWTLSEALSELKK